MLQRLIHTTADPGPLVARLALGLVVLPHGLQKVPGLFGGLGFTATQAYFAGLGIPAGLGVLAILAETAGATALVIGLGGRIAAAGVAAVLGTAAVLVHRPYGFFMNWYGTQAGEGFEYHLLGLGLAAVVLVAGSGALSIDRALANRQRQVAQSA